MIESEQPAAAENPSSKPLPCFALHEIKEVFRAPHKILDLTLSNYERFVITVSSGQNTLILALVLFYASVIFGLPFGMVLDPSRFWRITLLFLGSLTICAPSLQVFSAYIGCRINIKQNLAMALVITSVATIFTFGFFPILWFLKATMEESSQITVRHISLFLLSFSLLAGVSHLFRCLHKTTRLRGAYPMLLFCWQALFTFITYRMASCLELI